MSKDSENIEINIPIYEILLGIGIIGTIIGILAPFQRIEFLGMTLWFDPNLVFICVPIGVGLICGYITRKILPSNKNAYWLGFLLGIIGIIITICIKPKSNMNGNNSSKYEELQKLAELKQSGIITETEFNAQKERILRG